MKKKHVEAIERYRTEQRAMKSRRILKILITVAFLIGAGYLLWHTQQECLSTAATCVD